MKRKIFVRVFALSLLCALLVFGAGVFALRRVSRAVVGERLASEAKLLSALLRDEKDLERLRAYGESADLRVTVLSTDGELLFESNTEGALENHADREEVIGALAGNPHTVERYSDTFGCYMTYFAVCSRLEDGTQIVIRVAVKSSQVRSFLRSAVPLLALSLAVALVVSFFVAGRLSRQISRKVEDVADSLQTLESGEYRPIRTDSREPEFYAVLRRINEVSERTRANIALLSREQQKLSLVLDTIAQGVVALSAAGNIVFANNSAQAMFGGSAQDDGCPLNYLIDDTGLCDRIREATGSGGSFSYTTDGRDLAVTVHRVTGDALADEVADIVIFTDQTEVRAVARQKSDFFANASHELKTPITVTRGNAELILARDNIDEQTRHQVERILHETIRMGELISDMLKLSGLENQSARPTCAVPTPLHTVAGEVVAELHGAIADKKLNVTVRGEESVFMSPAEAYELISNLCSNAVNYNREGGSVEIVLDRVEEHVRLTVRDTGIGIPAEHLPRLCERFYRVDKSRSKKTGGTGLGLAIVKHICTLYGARLSIESEPDVGTCVTVIF